MLPVSYKKLWTLLAEKNINKTELKYISGISFNVLARMGKDETISIESIEKICFALNCDIGDMMEIVKPTPVQRFRCIELFAGAGGLALGLEKASFDSIPNLQQPII